MGKQLTVEICADSEYLDIYPSMTAEEFERFKIDRDEFDFDVRVNSMSTWNFRSLCVTDSEECEIYDIDGEDIIDDAIYPYDESAYFNEDDTEDPVKKVLCADLIKSLNEAYGPLNDLKPESFIVVMKWKAYKETSYFRIVIEDDDEFDPRKLQLVRDDYGLQWNRLENFIDVFPEDRASWSYIVYDNKIITIEDGENSGADFEAGYVFRTDRDGKVIAIDKFDL